MREFILEIKTPSGETKRWLVREVHESGGWYMKIHVVGFKRLLAFLASHLGASIKLYPCIDVECDDKPVARWEPNA